MQFKFNLEFNLIYRKDQLQLIQHKSSEHKNLYTQERNYFQNINLLMKYHLITQYGNKFSLMIQILTSQNL